MIAELLKMYDFVANKKDNQYLFVESNRIDCKINIDYNGNFLGLTILNNIKEDLPYAIRTNQIFPLLLFDQSEYVLGISLKNKKILIEKNQAFIHLIEDYKKYLEENNKDQRMVQAVLLFYSRSRSNEFEKAKKEFIQNYLTEKEDKSKNKNINITFEVNGQNILTNDAFEFWQQKNMKENISKSIKDYCSICGEISDIPEKHPLKIRKLQTTLINCNDTNVEFIQSYGINVDKGTCNFPICFSCAYKYAIVLNYLLDNKEYHYSTFANEYAIFWNKNPIPIFNILEKTDPIEVRKFINSVYTACYRNSPEANDYYFYIIGYRTNKGRIYVREGIEVNLQTIIQNIEKYFNSQEISSKNKKYLSIEDIITTISPNTNPKDDTKYNLFKYAVFGDKLPDNILNLALLRVKKSKSVTENQVKILKMCLNEERIKKTMNINNKTPAYLLGRLFANIEKVSHDVLGDNNKGSFYRSNFVATMQYPLSSFVKINQKYSYYLDKLYKINPGIALYWDKKIQEIISQLSQIPETSDPKFQAEFIIGYYQQKEENYTNKKETENE